MELKKVTIYEPDQRTRIGLFRTLFIIAQNVYNSRELIYQLYRRDLLMQYKKSFLGLGWMFFGPIMGIISWILMNAAGVLAPGDVGVPYPVYVLLSTSLWGLFMNFYSSTSQTLQVAQAYITQVNFHHEALLVKQGLQDLTNFSITLFMNLIIMFAFHVIPHWQIFLLPLFIIPMFMISATMGIIISVANTITTDIQRIASFLLSIFMFITPIIYSSKIKVPVMQMIIHYNPLTYLICGPRDLILYGRMDYPMNYLYSLGGVFIVFTFIIRYFYVNENRVIEKMI